jgi:hypothetical protein
MPDMCGVPDGKTSLLHLRHDSRGCQPPYERGELAVRGRLDGRGVAPVTATFDREDRLVVELERRRDGPVVRALRMQSHLPHTGSVVAPPS